MKFAFIRLRPLLGAYLFVGWPALAEPPLLHVQTIDMPSVPAGPYADHMALDVKRQRLFTTPQAEKAIAVLDLRTATVMHTIRGISNPVGCESLNHSVRRPPRAVLRRTSAVVASIHYARFVSARSSTARHLCRADAPRWRPRRHR